MNYETNAHMYATKKSILFISEIKEKNIWFITKCFLRIIELLFLDIYFCW